MRDPLEDRPTADPTDDDGGSAPRDPERAEQEAIARRNKLDEARWGHEPEEPPTPEQVRESGAHWLGVGFITFLCGVPMSLATDLGLALLVGGIVLMIEGPRRMITGRRTVDMPPAVGCLTVLGMLGAAAFVLWLLLTAVLR